MAERLSNKDQAAKRAEQAKIIGKVIMCVAFPTFLISCAQNPDVTRLHGKLSRLRVLLEHPTTPMEELRRNAQAARLDFQSHKQSFSGQAQEACDKALFSTEILASFNGMRGSDPPGRHCAELSKAGAYDSESACHKEMDAYKEPSNYSGETLTAINQLDRAVLHLALVRLERATQERMRNAEALTAK